MASVSTEEYLEAIYKLQQEKAKVKSADLAASLNISPPSVAEMTNKMADSGLIKKSTGSGLILTKKGEKSAIRMIGRHRLAECFLVDMVGLSLEKAHIQACKFEHILSDEVEEGLRKLLNNPKRCPHGHPVPNKNGVFDDRSIKNYKNLSDVNENENVAIRSIPENDEEKIRYLDEIKIRPGNKATVVNVPPFEEPIQLRVNNKIISLSRELARLIMVEIIK